jgi:adenosylhomocysteine nucleosidase
MPVTRLLRCPTPSAQNSWAIVCAALALEAEIIERQLEREMWESEAASLSEFIARAANDGCRGIVSYGLAGGLCSNLRAGDIVIGSEIIEQNASIRTDDLWSAWLLSAMPTARYGPIVGVDLPILASTLRGELGLQSGALVADMESHVVARLAATHGLRFVALRVVVDAAGCNVPQVALACLLSNGEISRWRLGRLLLGRPSETLGVIRLCADWRPARKALLHCGDALLASVHAVEL